MRSHALVLLPATFLFVFTSFTVLLPILAALSFIRLFALQAQRRAGWSFLGEAANLVTLVRLLGVFAILIFANHWPEPLAAGVALVILVLDGLDGYLARRLGTSSDFGAYLDMETDAFYVLCLALVLHQQEYLGWWILGIGLLRYVYFLILYGQKAPEQKEQRLWLARFIAVILMASLPLCWLLPEQWSVPLVATASLLVLYSFGRSFYLAKKSW